MACSSMSYTPFVFYRLMFSMCLFCFCLGYDILFAPMTNDSLPIR